MSYEFYKIIHLVSIVLLFSGLIGLLTVKMSNGALEGKTKSLIFITHGVGTTLLLISGFGLAARLNYMAQLPGWIYAKLVIWLLFGAAISIVKRKGMIGWPLYISMLGIFACAAYLAVTKPF